jgi:hypothetical protein
MDPQGTGSCNIATSMRRHFPPKWQVGGAWSNVEVVCRQVSLLDRCQITSTAARPAMYVCIYAYTHVNNLFPLLLANELCYLKINYVFKVRFLASTLHFTYKSIAEKPCSR